MKKALITGVLGQDGTYLARLLIEKGYKVHGLIRLPFEREESRIRKRFPEEVLEHLQFHTGALEDPSSLAFILKESAPDEIYHLAGVSDSRQSFLVPEQTITSITLGTLRLLETGRLLIPDARFFLASSAEVFGSPEASPQTEQTRRKPLTPYGVARQAMEGLADVYRHKYQQFISVGILYNHESPLRPPNYLSRRVAIAVAAIKRGEMTQLTLGDLTPERDWSDARDFVRGYWLSLQQEKPGDYVFASGQKRTVEDFVRIAFAAAGLNYREHVQANTRVVPTEVRAGLCGNPAKARQQLGWEPRWNFNAMLQDLVEAELENRPELLRAQP